MLSIVHRIISVFAFVLGFIGVYMYAIGSKDDAIFILLCAILIILGLIFFLLSTILIINNLLKR